MVYTKYSIDLKVFKMFSVPSGALDGHHPVCLSAPGRETMGRLEPGTKGRFTTKVENIHLASSMGNTGVDVLATPTLAWMFENAATDALAPVLKEGEISVGTWISVKHLKPTPPGMSVTTTVKLLKVKGIRYLFEARVDDEVEKVAEGNIERAIISRDRFYEGLERKRSHTE